MTSMSVLNESPPDLYPNHREVFQRRKFSPSDSSCGSTITTPTGNRRSQPQGSTHPVTWCKPGTIINHPQSNLWSYIPSISIFTTTTTSSVLRQWAICVLTLLLITLVSGNFQENLTPRLRITHLRKYQAHVAHRNTDKPIVLSSKWGTTSTIIESDLAVIGGSVPPSPPPLLIELNWNPSLKMQHHVIKQ